MHVGLWLSCGVGLHPVFREFSAFLFVSLQHPGFCSLFFSLFIYILLFSVSWREGAWRDLLPCKPSSVLKMCLLLFVQNLVIAGRPWEGPSTLCCQQDSTCDQETRVQMCPRLRLSCGLNRARSGPGSGSAGVLGVFQLSVASHTGAWLAAPCPRRAFVV